MKATRLSIIGFVIFLICFVGFIFEVKAETFGACVARCKADVMYLSDCMDDEKQHWDAEITARQLKSACLDLIRNERIYCSSECAKEEQKKNSPALNFYDKHVRSFPETNE